MKYWPVLLLSSCILELGQAQNWAWGMDEGQVGGEKFSYYYSRPTREPIGFDDKLKNRMGVFNRMMEIEKFKEKVIKQENVENNVGNLHGGETQPRFFFDNFKVWLDDNMANILDKVNFNPSKFDLIKKDHNITNKLVTITDKLDQKVDKKKDNVVVIVQSPAPTRTVDTRKDKVVVVSHNPVVTSIITVTQTLYANHPMEVHRNQYTAIPQEHNAYYESPSQVQYYDSYSGHHQKPSYYEPFRRQSPYPSHYDDRLRENNAAPQREKADKFDPTNLFVVFSLDSSSIKGMDSPTEDLNPEQETR